MNSIRKKGKCRILLSFLIIVCVLLSTLPTVNAQDEKQNYVALGDSISTGYGLSEDETPFTQQIAQNNSFEFVSLAQDGETSASLLERISEVSAASNIAAADVVTITIGGNDLMNAMYIFIANRYNEDNPENPKTAEEIASLILNGNFDIIMFALNNIQNFLESQEAISAINNFSVNFTKIIAGIKTLNPNAYIVVANQYNPYGFLDKELTGGIFDSYIIKISTIFDNGVNTLNAAISKLGNQLGCVVADVYSVFDTAEQNPCNASYNSATFKVNLDYHPNAYGHSCIANTFNELLSYRAAVTPNGVSFEPQIEGYETAGVQEFTIDNIGSKELSNIKVSLSGTNADCFTLNTENTSESIEAGSNTSFTIAPKNGITKGSYTANVEITADEIMTITKKVSFEVYEAMSVIGIDDGKTYCGSVEVTVTGNSFESAEINGTEILDNKFTVEPAQGVQTIIIKDKTGNTVTYNITVNDGHITEKVGAKNPTCTQEGYTGDLICTVCGETIERGTVIEKLEHNFENGACTECSELDPQYSRGDANMDKKVNITDATCIQKYLALHDLEENFSTALADMDNNKSVTIVDATLIQIFVLNESK